MTDDERTSFVARIAALSSALRAVGRLDKTAYDYARPAERSGQMRVRRVVLGPDGQMPAVNERFLTPRELAGAALLADKEFSDQD